MASPPILEIYVVWHPDDQAGAAIGDALISHFHGPAYAGLAGGAVEVYLRHAGWESPEGPPRPLPFMDALPASLQPAQITAVVPILGRNLARAVRSCPDWLEYVKAIFDADSPGANEHEGRVVAVYPVRAPGADLSGTLLAEISVRPQALTPRDIESPDLARDLAQAISQRIAREFAAEGLEERVTVFISHTKRGPGSGDDVLRLVELVREVLRTTRLEDFFDAQDIQLADDWEATLDAHAARHAMLMVRTDKYASREWTQREVLSAKIHDIPIVSMYAVRNEEDRGSFLMDHVPVIAWHPTNERASIARALNRLVDEALKRALWTAQRVYLERDGFDWLPVHAPEPVTLVEWLRARRMSDKDPNLLIMHPDPPLGPKERETVLQLCELAGITSNVDILTPRTFSTRGGSSERD